MKLKKIEQDYEDEEEIEVKKEFAKDIEQEKKVDKLKSAKITEVVASTSNAFELETGEIVDLNGLLLRIYNKLLRIERSVA